MFKITDDVTLVHIHSEQVTRKVYRLKPRTVHYLFTLLAFVSCNIHVYRGMRSRKELVKLHREADAILRQRKLRPCVYTLTDLRWTCFVRRERCRTNNP